jgi:hypothetical protein
MTGVLPGTASAGEEPLWIGEQHRGKASGVIARRLVTRRARHRSSLQASSKPWQPFDEAISGV